MPKFAFFSQCALVLFATLTLAGCDSSTPPQSASPPTTDTGNNTASGSNTQNTGPINTANIQVLDISERSQDGKNGIAVTFNTQIDAAVNIQSYFSMVDQSNQQVDGRWVIGKDTKQVWFMNTEPQQVYSISVNPGILAKNGSKLLMGASEKITSRTLAPSVSFDSDGMILPTGYTSGLPVVAVNIDAVDVDFFRIKDDNIAQFIQYASDTGRQSWYTANLAQYGDLTYSARFDLNPPKNTRIKRDIQLQRITQLQKPGLYFAVMREAGNYEEKSYTWFSITDIGLHVRQYKNQLDVHAASLTTGKPLANLDLQLRNSSSTVLQKNRTTENGVASFNGDYNNATLIVAQAANQYTLLNLQQPALDLAEFELGSRPQLPNELFIYGPRDLYRPGETAIFSALLRNHDGQLSQAAVLEACLRNPSGMTVKNFKWQPDTQGYFQTAWNIPSNAPTGRWELVVQGILKKPANFAFNVEEFLPERLKLTLGDGGERTVVTGKKSTVNLPVIGEYLYGAPAAGNKLGTLLQVEHWREPVTSLKGYQFGDITDTGFQSYQELKDVLLDSKGETTLKLAPTWSETHSPLKATLIASLYESGGRPVTRAHPILLWPNEYLPGIRPHFGDSNPEANTQVKFDLVQANVKGELSAAENVEVTLIREDRQYFWEYNTNQGWHWNFNEKEFPVASDNIPLKADGPTTVSYPVDWGNYRLVVRNTNTGTLTSVHFYAGYNWYYDWKNAGNSIAARPDRINLALDKPAYDSGDTAELKILPPANGEVLVLVESDRPLWSQKISVNTKGSTLAIPIDSTWDTHNIYVSALLIQPANNEQKITPKRAMGVIHLPLNREPRRLPLRIDAPEKILPASTLRVDLQLPPDTAIENTRVTLAAVDVGVLNISDFKTPDPFNYFFGQRAYEVNARDIYADVIEAHQADAAQQRFGGDADLVRGGKKPQSDVHIVSLFQEPVAFDADGKAQVDLKIPDFNGRLRLMALAFNDKHYGSLEQEVTVAAPIVAEIAMPRFLALGDSSLLALDVQNLTEENQILSIQLQTESPLQLATNHHTVTLQPKAKTTLKYSVEAIDFDGLATITANISGATIDDFSRAWKLGVRPAYPALTENQQHILKPGESLHLTDTTLDNVLPSTLQASVSISPIVNLQIEEQLKNLLRYPYGCLEQTSSRAWPLTYATPENQARFKLSPITEATRRDMIQKGIDRILTFQRRNGSFGLWSKDSPEEHWLTVYATDFLLHAKDLGMEIPDATLDSALKRLSSYISSSRLFPSQRWSNDAKHYAFSTRAYAAYVLSRLNRAPLGNLRNLYAKNFNDANSGLPQTHLGLALLTMGDKKNGNEALKKAINNFPENFQYWGDYGSDIRDIGMTIHLLMTHKVMQDQALQLSLALRDSLISRRWLSTQERISLFMAGIALEQDLLEGWQASWQLGEASAESLSEKRTWKKHLNAEQLQAGFTLTSQHTKPLYVSNTINAYGTRPPAAREGGIAVSRSWFNSQGEAVTPHTVKSGELFLVHLAVHGKKRVPDALIVNLLPAGFELENQNLAHAIKLDKFVIEGNTLTDLQNNTLLKHTEYRDDRFVAALDHNGYAISHVFFMVRAVTPGRYKVPPAIVEDMYRPEIRGVSDTLDTITITE